ncbi:MAG: hypothetical protein J6V07_00300 [Clostridia bacterium]|nr:hypothetical protein [Clostridia bacterium]
MEYDEMIAEEMPEEELPTAAPETAGVTPSAEEVPSPEEVTEEAGEEGAEVSPDYRRQAEEDLLVLRAAIPELRGAESLSVLGDPGRYGELREAGLDPIEAYLATEGRRLLRRPRDNRTHLVSSLGRTASPAGGRISAAELHAARDLFPGLGDGEIEALWRRVGSPGRR